MAVQLILGQEFTVGSRGLDAPLVQQEDLIARADRRNPVRQEDGRPARQDPGEGIVQEGLDIVVNGSSRLFAAQKGRIAQDSSRQRDQKLLPGIQMMAHLADERLISLRKPLNELMSVSDLGRFDNLR